MAECLVIASKNKKNALTQHDCGIQANLVVITNMVNTAS